MAFDPRLTPARPDLAAEHLRGQGRGRALRRRHGARGVARSAPLRREPSPDAPLDTEALKGERVTVYETDEEGWCLGPARSATATSAGCRRMRCARPGPPPTHKVAALRTLVFPGPSIKLPPVEALLARRRVAGRAERGAARRDAGGGFVPARHLAPLDAREPDFVAVAERFLGVPYLWGGKTEPRPRLLGPGAGRAAPPAASPARATATCRKRARRRACGDLADLRRGDLMFWKGHVAIVRDRDTLIHANAFHMAVAIEPMRAVARIKAAGSEMTCVRRLA